VLMRDKFAHALAQFISEKRPIASVLCMTILLLSSMLEQVLEDTCPVILQPSIRRVRQADTSATVSENWLQLHFLQRNTAPMMPASSSVTVSALYTTVREQTRLLARTCLSQK
jgi:hypothetical protein